MSTKPTPEVQVVTTWPAGTSFLATLQHNLPDRPKWQAATHWWQAALGQTVRFSPTSAALKNTRELPKLELTIDPRSRSLTASLREGKEARVLARGSFADTSPTPDLLLAIDHVAWCTRLALGEQAKEPRPVAAITSALPSVVTAVVDAAELLHTGAFSSAHRTLQDPKSVV